jgi:hypothetical protein
VERRRNRVLTNLRIGEFNYSSSSRHEAQFPAVDGVEGWEANVFC